MPGNRAETRDECNFEATISYDPCQAGVRNLCPFKLFSSRSTAIFESAIQKLVPFSNDNIARGVLEVSDFTQKSASSDDSKPNPQAPH